MTLERLPFKADASALIESWSEANSWTVDNLRKYGYDARYFPRERLVYNWNFERQASDIQRRLGDNVFVPERIFFAERQGFLGTYVIWTNYIPMVFPQVDWVFIGHLKGDKDFVFRGFSRLDDIVLGLANHLRKLSEPVSHYLLFQELAAESRKSLDELPLSDMKEIKALQLNVSFIDVPLG